MAFALLDHTEEKTTINEILTGTFREKDRQINFAIEELEKVKEKIRTRKDGWGKYPCCDCCINIIDAEISELKGEQYNE